MNIPKQFIDIPLVKGRVMEQIECGIHEMRQVHGRKQLYLICDLHGLDMMRAESEDRTGIEKNGKYKVFGLPVEVFLIVYLGNTTVTIATELMKDQLTQKYIKHYKDAMSQLGVEIDLDKGEPVRFSSCEEVE